MNKKNYPAICQGNDVFLELGHFYKDSFTTQKDGPCR